MVGLLFCLVYMLYIHNELRKTPDVGNQVGKAILQSMNCVAHKQQFQIASCLTGGH